MYATEQCQPQNASRLFQVSDEHATIVTHQTGATNEAATTAAATAATTNFQLFN